MILLRFEARTTVAQVIDEDFPPGALPHVELDPELTKGAGQFNRSMVGI